MKKLFALFLTLTMILTLVACGGSEKPPANSGDNQLLEDLQDAVGGKDNADQPDASQAGDSGKSGKTFEFPQREYVPDWAVYSGGGAVSFTNPGGKLSDRTCAQTWINDATAEDAEAYIKTLKENGLTTTDPTYDEVLNDAGFLIWFGTNADKSLCISVSFYEGGDEVEDIFYNTGTHQYNLLIQLANYDFMDI